jgi:catechol 2,3-dioxygenase-like lactoylglutathione lyase family enzyme
MSTAEVRSNDASSAASVGKVDTKLEVVAIPVSDVDRAKKFYEGLGWRLDADFDKGGRAVQFTPPGSECRFTSARTSRPQRPGPPRACS